MVNPLVYVNHNGDFKMAFRDIFQSLKDEYLARTARKHSSKCISGPLRLIGDNKDLSNSPSKGNGFILHLRNIRWNFYVSFLFYFELKFLYADSLLWCLIWVFTVR